jgi:hypothetical protein
MLRMDISSLRRSELRNLLANARARGQDGLADEIEAQLARADNHAVVPSEIRTWAVPADEVLPMDPEPGLALDLGIADRPAPRRRPVGLFAALAAGLVVLGSGLAWSLNGEPGLPRAEAPVPAAAPKAPPAPRAMALRVAPTPVVAEAEAPPAKPEPTVVAVAEPVRERPTRLDPCARPPSPADRLLCGDLALNLLDHEMRDAYGRAMEAGADPLALRESQTAWRRTRDPIGDPRALAEVYDRRIRDLKAAAEAPL